jgi:hypothetical protein
VFKKPLTRRFAATDDTAVYEPYGSLGVTVARALMLRTVLEGTVMTLLVTVMVLPIVGGLVTPVTAASFQGTDALPIEFVSVDVIANGFKTYTLLKHLSPTVLTLNVVPLL